MTDLSQFGVDVDQPDAGGGSGGGRDSGHTPNFPNGRCPAIASGHRGRCRAAVSRMNEAEGFCGTHGRQHDPWTIHDDPETLIILTGEIDTLSLDEVDPDDVDFDLGRIREAVAAVQEAKA